MPGPRNGRSCFAPSIFQRIDRLSFVTALSAATIFILVWQSLATAQAQQVASTSAPSAQQQSQPQLAETPATGSISGRITHADTGAPAGGVVISLLATIQNGVPPAPDALYLQTFRTGPDGVYKFSSVGPGTYRVHVIKGSGFSPREPSQTVTLGAGQTIGNIDLQLQPMGTISGTVLDEDNDPIAGMFAIAFSTDLSAKPGDPGCFGITRTNDRGDFRLSGLTPGNCYVAVAADPPVGARLHPLNRAVYYPDAASIEKAKVVQVKPGGEVPNILFHIPLEITGSTGPTVAQQETQLPAVAPDTSAGSVSGHIYRADTRVPLGGAVIHLYRYRTDDQIRSRQFVLPYATRSGSDGAYTFALVAPGTYTLSTEHYGFASIPANGAPTASKDRIAVGAGESIHDVDVQLQPTGAISGNVSDQNNFPVDEIGVSVQCTSSAEGSSSTGGGQTDDEGNFRASGLTPGDCYISAHPGGVGGVGPNSQLGFHEVYYPNTDEVEKAQMVSIKAGAEVTGINLIVRSSPTYRIKVKILDSASLAESAAYLISVALGIPTLAGEDGTAELRGIPNGTYTIRVNRGQVRIGPNGQRFPSGGGPVVGSAIVQVMDGDVSVTIPISSFPPQGRQ
jgi:hypothetical protein